MNKSALYVDEAVILLKGKKNKHGSIPVENHVDYKKHKFALLKIIKTEAIVQIRY
jgi:hypothetical protein